MSKTAARFLRRLNLKSDPSLRVDLNPFMDTRNRVCIVIIAMLCNKAGSAGMCLFGCVSGGGATEATSCNWLLAIRKVTFGRDSFCDLAARVPQQALNFIGRKSGFDLAGWIRLKGV